jgi:hypothetical protein
VRNHCNSAILAQYFYAVLCGLQRALAFAPLVVKQSRFFSTAHANSFIFVIGECLAKTIIRISNGGYPLAEEFFRNFFPLTL